MKKLLIIALSLSIFACSKKDDPQPKSVVQPPVTVTGPIVTITTTVVGVTPQKPKVDSTLPQLVDYKMYIAKAVVTVKAPFEYVPASQILGANGISWPDSYTALKISIPDPSTPRQKWDSVFLMSTFDILTEKDLHRPVYYVKSSNIYEYFKAIDSLAVMYNEHTQFTTGAYNTSTGINNSQLNLPSSFTETTITFELDASLNVVSGGGVGYTESYFKMPVSSMELYDPNTKLNYTEFYVAFKDCITTQNWVGYTPWSINFNYPGLKGYK